MNIRHTLHPGDAEALAALWAQLGWGQDSDEGRRHVQAVLAGSGWLAIAALNEKVVGYARALSDGVAVTYLVEVGVSPDFQRRGVGSALIRSCLTAFAHTAIYADVVPGAVALLTRHGINPRPSYLIACARGPVPA